jgi:hypothetical protein
MNYQNLDQYFKIFRFGAKALHASFLVTRVLRLIILVPLGPVRVIVQRELGSNIDIVEIRDDIVFIHYNLY